MRYGFKIREGEQPILFTSNKEVLYPIIQSIAEKHVVVEGDYQRYTYLMGKLLEILEELETMVNQKRIKHKYMLVNGEELEISDYFILVALRMIWRYSEPLDGESIGRLYQELDEIEKWL